MPIYNHSFRKVLQIFLLAAVFMSGLPSAAQTKTARGQARFNSAQQPVSKFGNVEGITAAQLKNYLEFIASDELEGRDTPSRGLDIAAMYIADHLRSWGIKPAGDNGTYFQKFPLERRWVDSATSKVEINGQTFNYGDDFLAQRTSGAIAGRMVFVGHGFVVTSKNINPYEGINVRDKIIITTEDLPAGVELTGEQGKDWESPIGYAQKNGAKALIGVPFFSLLSNWQNNRQLQTEKGYIYMPGKPAQSIPSISASPRLLTAIFKNEKISAELLYAQVLAGQDIQSFELDSNKTIAIQIGVKTHSVMTQNVVGILEGSDPTLKNEYLAFGAHYDHVGIGNPVNGDAIYNGADDDGSGTVSVMAIAEALSKGAQRPKRSILFIWHAGEEKGLWGSEYFTDHPTVPINSIITELNIDMIGRFQNPGDENHPLNKFLPKPDEIFVIGSKMMSTDLGELSEATNKAFLNLKFNYKYDDPDDPEQFFYRSDHYNYARKGIPIIFYMDGVHADYHKPSDSIEKINFEQMEKVARTIFALGWELANRPTRPKVDKPLQTN